MRFQNMLLVLISTFTVGAHAAPWKAISCNAYTSDAVTVLLDGDRAFLQISDPGVIRDLDNQFESAHQRGGISSPGWFNAYASKVNDNYLSFSGETESVVQSFGGFKFKFWPSTVIQLKPIPNTNEYRLSFSLGNGRYGYYFEMANWHFKDCQLHTYTNENRMFSSSCEAGLN